MQDNCKGLEKALEAVQRAVTVKETVVILVSMRGKTEPSEMLAGVGGIPPGSLLSFDLQPNGQTWLWERVASLIDILTNLPERPPARILLLDLSASMASQVEVLKRMWASVPNSGVQAQGLEIMVVTDGHDNESGEAFAGAGGLLALLAHATRLGWDCGQPQGTVTIGKLYVTLLDVGDGSVSKQLAEQLGDSSTTVVWTRDVDLVARIVRGRRPDVRGLLSKEAAEQHYPALPTVLQQQIEAVERHLKTNGRHGFDLPIALEQALGKLQEPIRSLARQAVLEFLNALLVGGDTLEVEKRGQHKAFHSGINSLLYQLQGLGIVKHNKSTPRLWTRDVMYTYILEPLELLCQSPINEQPIEAVIDGLLEDPEQADEQVALFANNPDRAQALLHGLLKRVRAEGDSGKRQKTE